MRGFRVLRFTNDQIDDDLPLVLERILNECREREPNPPMDHSPLPRSGRGLGG